MRTTTIIRKLARIRDELVALQSEIETTAENVDDLITQIEDEEDFEEED